MDLRLDRNSTVIEKHLWKLCKIHLSWSQIARKCGAILESTSGFTSSPTRALSMLLMLPRRDLLFTKATVACPGDVPAMPEVWLELDLELYGIMVRMSPDFIPKLWKTNHTNLLSNIVGTSFGGRRCALGLGSLRRFRTCHRSLFLVGKQMQAGWEKYIELIFK